MEPNLLLAMQVRKWNSLVTPKMKLIGETETAMVFLHGTKGYRRISKKRLGVQ